MCKNINTFCNVDISRLVLMHVDEKAMVDVCCVNNQLLITILSHWIAYYNTVGCNFIAIIRCKVI